MFRCWKLIGRLLSFSFSIREEYVHFWTFMIKIALLIFFFPSWCPRCCLQQFKDKDYLWKLSNNGRFQWATHFICTSDIRIMELILLSMWLVIVNLLHLTWISILYDFFACSIFLFMFDRSLKLKLSMIYSFNAFDILFLKPIN